MKNITVEYAAVEPVADEVRLVNCVRREIKHHLQSIHDLPIAGWDLHVSIIKCEMRANYGAVNIALSGSVNGVPISHSIKVGDEPDFVELTTKGYANRRTKIAVSNLFSFIARLVLPSELVAALGRRRISGRLVRAWSDCFREIRIHIDKAVHRPDSGIQARWRATWISAVLLGLLACGICAAAYFLRESRVADKFRAQLACIFVGIGVYGVIASSGLLLLPDRFFQSERSGLRLVSLIGVKGLTGIRVVAMGLFLLAALLFFAPGVYWLFFE